MIKNGENQIVDTDFDPIELLNKGSDGKFKTSGKIENQEPPANSGDDKDKKDEKDEKPPVVELSDEQIQQSLKKTNESPEGGDKNKGKNQDEIPEKTPSGKKIDSESPYWNQYKAMVAVGEWEEDQEFDGSAEAFLELKEKNLQKDLAEGINTVFDQAFKQNPDGREAGLALFKHLQAGGKISDFIDLYSPTEIDSKNLDSEDEEIANQTAKKLIRSYYESLDWKPEAIDKKIANYEKLGILTQEAKELEEPYFGMVKKSQEDHQKKLDQLNADREKDRKAVRAQMKEMFDSNHSFGDIKLYENEKEKQLVQSRLFHVDESGQTEFSKDLNKELKDPRFLLFLEVALRKKLYKNEEGSGLEKDDPEKKAMAALKEKLGGALLNKNISSKKAIDSSSVENTSDYKFNFDDVRLVI